MTRPRKPTDNEMASWFTATETAPPRNLEQLRYIIRQENPVRWWRLQADLKWIKRVMKKLGYNPEDARWLL